MIIIIGGGVFGLAIGWRLAQAKVPVTILEKGRVGHGASWAAAGMMMPWKLSRVFSDELFALQWESHQRWPDFAAELKAASGVDFYLRDEGRFFTALSDKAVRRFRRQYDYHRQVGVPVEWLEGDNIRRQEPLFGPEVQAAIFSPIARWVDARQVIRALRQAFLNAGGILKEGTEVVRIQASENSVQGVQLDHEMIEAKTVILAAGAWSGHIPGLSKPLQRFVEPIKGQTLTLQMSPDTVQLRYPIIGPVYLVPRSGNQLIVGPTTEDEAGFQINPTVGGVHEILSKAQQIVPSITQLPILEMGAGLRPTSEKRQPVLGPTSTKGLILASGGHSHGFLLTPIVADAFVQLILRHTVFDLIAPFLPE
ncbi:MAG: glycine oxidase ThiO [Chloroflexota bacterium]